MDISDKKTRITAGGQAGSNGPHGPHGPHGMRWVAEALRLEDYPMEKRDIDYSVGDLLLEDARGAKVPVRDLTDRLPREQFDSAESVVKALQAALNDRESEAA